jgi:hypothetical protein
MRAHPTLLAGLLAVASACEGSTGPVVGSPESLLRRTVSSTDERPYTFGLPERWSVEEIVHSDGSSFVISPPDGPVEPGANGKVWGVVDPSGQILPFEPAPDEEEIRSMEADGSEVSLRTILVDGRPAWEMVALDDSRTVLTLFSAVDVGGGAGILLSFAGAPDSVHVFRAIVRSVRIDEGRLSRTLAEALRP